MISAYDTPLPDGRQGRQQTVRASQRADPRHLLQARSIGSLLTAHGLTLTSTVLDEGVMGLLVRPARVIILNARYCNIDPTVLSDSPPECLIGNLTVVGSDGVEQTDQGRIHFFSFVSLALLSASRADEGFPVCVLNFRWRESTEASFWGWCWQQALRMADVPHVDTAVVQRAALSGEIHRMRTHISFPPVFRPHAKSEPQNGNSLSSRSSSLSTR